MDALNILFDSPWYWLIAGALLVMAEMALPGVLLLWVGLGAIAVGAFMVVWPDAPHTVQLLLLAACMLVAVYSGIKWQSKARAKGRDRPGGLNAGMANYIGRQAVAMGNFHEGAGRIRVDDTFYSATSKHSVSQGETVIIREIRNGVFFVDKI